MHNILKNVKQTKRNDRKWNVWSFQWLNDWREKSMDIFIYIYHCVNGLSMCKL